MTGRGSVAVLLGTGIWVAVACGGRTLGDEYDEPGVSGAGPSSGRGGSAGRGGSKTAGGSMSTGGTVVGYGGAYPGGTSAGGSYPYPGGAYPYPGGAYPYPGGAYSFGGTFSMGGSFGTGGGFPGGGASGRPGGACCESQGAPLCQPYPVAKCVCATLPYCCTESWDERCAAMVEPLGCGYCGKPPQDCQTCVFSRCKAELTQCFEDFGCLAIFGCVQDTGCNTFECYRPETCAAVIDQYGGPAGPAMSYLLKAVSCTIESGCPCD